MSTKLYVGNLSYTTTENDLEDAFAAHGAVSRVELIQDRTTGRSRGFGFVTMETEEGAQAAITAMNGRDLQGRTLTVNVARAREERPSEGGRGGGPRRYGR